MTSPFGDVLGDSEHYAYEDVIRSERWRQIGVLMRAFYGSCQVCGGSERLQVHHVSYRCLGSESPRDLLLLCDGCHDRHHRREADWSQHDIACENPESWEEIVLAVGMRD